MSQKSDTGRKFTAFAFRPQAPEISGHQRLQMRKWGYEGRPRMSVVENMKGLADLAKSTGQYPNFTNKSQKQKTQFRDR